MTRLQLERHQVWIYLAAIATGLVLGGVLPEVRASGELLLWPALVLSLYAAFAQVPLLQLRAAFGDRRFLVAVVTGNFLLVPLLVFALVQLLPADPARQIAGRSATAATVQSIRQQLGLDLPLWQQYLRYLGNRVQGDMGRS